MTRKPPRPPTLAGAFNTYSFIITVEIDEYAYDDPDFGHAPPHPATVIAGRMAHAVRDIRGIRAVHLVVPPNRDGVH